MTALLLVLVLGIGTTFWSLVGLGRWLTGRRAARAGRQLPSWVPTPRDVAILIAAHNEELVIGETIRAAATLVDVSDIYIISDGSKDSTADVARSAGANVLELNPNRGKAGALAAGIEHFDLCGRYEVVMLLDADTHLAPDYLATGLPLFADRTVVAVAGRAKSIRKPEPPGRFGRFLVAYRERLYLIVQLLLKFGQAAHWANAVTIVPGFASMYRTSALKQIDVTGAGLVIEDFNMTFEVHAKKLGRIEFHPQAAIAYTQDPDNFGEYAKQVRRWILGFWQTVRRHGVFHFGFFWFALCVFIIELLLSCVMLVLLIPLFLVSTAAAVWVAIKSDPGTLAVQLSGLLTPRNLALGVLLPDYVLTVFAAVLLKNHRFLWLGIGFPLMRIIDAAICLRVLPRAWIGRSSGVWVSPTRRAMLPSQLALATASTVAAGAGSLGAGSMPTMSAEHEVVTRRTVATVDAPDRSGWSAEAAHDRSARSPRLRPNESRPIGSPRQRYYRRVEEAKAARVQKRSRTL